jgi:predicted transglutaminase-like cysteine proteinase
MIAAFTFQANAAITYNTVPIPIDVPTIDRWEEILKTFPNFDCSKFFDCDTIKSLSNRTVVSKIGFVNAFVNSHIEYRTDAKDYWATPYETAMLKYGDCEDFVFLKMAMLYQIGVDIDDMQMLVVKNENNEFHAVLKIKKYIMDSVTPKILKDREVNNYKILYSLQGHKAYVHGKRK